MPSPYRFLGALNPPDDLEKRETTSPLDELYESDVVWSSSEVAAIKDFDAAAAVVVESHPTTPLSTSSSSSFSTSPLQFQPPSAAGLSAAIAAVHSQSRSPVVQRKKIAMNPMMSAAGAAAISTVLAPPSQSTSPLSRSAPVKVPIWMDSRRMGRTSRAMDPKAAMERFDEEDNERFDDEEMLPPHEIVARSQRTTTFSVYEGVGRTLKGRDLTRVRNAVMQETGFLE